MFPLRGKREIKSYHLLVCWVFLFSNKRRNSEGEASYRKQKCYGIMVSILLAPSLLSFRQKSGVLLRLPNTGQIESICFLLAPHVERVICDNVSITNVRNALCKPWEELASDHTELYIQNHVSPLEELQSCVLGVKCKMSLINSCVLNVWPQKATFLVGDSWAFQSWDLAEGNESVGAGLQAPHPGPASYLFSLLPNQWSCDQSSMKAFVTTKPSATIPSPTQRMEAP